MRSRTEGQREAVQPLRISQLREPIKACFLLEPIRSLSWVFCLMQLGGQEQRHTMDATSERTSRFDVSEQSSLPSIQRGLDETVGRLRKNTPSARCSDGGLAGSPLDTVV